MHYKKNYQNETKEKSFTCPLLETVRKVGKKWVWNFEMIASQKEIPALTNHEW